MNLSRTCLRLITAAIAVLFFLLFGSQSLRSQVPVADKIHGEVLAHQRAKERPQGRPMAEHRKRLREQGLNAENLTAEECALYSTRKLTAQEIADLARTGIRISPDLWVPPVPGHHAVGFHLATVDYASLDVIRTDARFVRMDSTETANYPLNDLGRTMIKVSDVQNGTGVTARTGAGVKVAVADSGVDLTHGDIPTPAEAYDMTKGTNTATWGTSVANTVSPHGTHVTGTVLGRGTLSGGKYKGSAPGASLYFYKIGDDTTSSASTTDEVEAINRAVAVGAKVFTMSYGGISTYMDGSEAMEQAIDAAVAAGVTVFISAGNDGVAATHDSISVAPGTTSGTFGFTISNTSSGTAYTTVEQIRVIWRDSAAGDANITLACTNLGVGETLTQAFSGFSTRNTDAKRYNLTPNIAAGGSKTYAFTLQNTASSGTTPLVHCYRLSGGKGTFTSPDPSYTIGSPAIADSAITVGAWTHRQNWTNWKNSSFSFSGSVAPGNLAPFSSLGPRIDGTTKPTLVAPGTAMISARDSVGTLAATDALIIDNDGLNLDGSGPANYYVMQGTSMACPMAAGVAALLLENNPSLTPAQIRQALTSTASNSATPNNSVGSGLIDALAAILATSSNNPPTISGAVAGQAVNDNATVAPFSGVTLADADTAQTQAVSVTLDNAAKGTFTAGSLTASGFSSAGGGVYNFSGTAAAATTAIRQLVYAPTANRVTPNSTETTTVTISINDGVASAVTNNATTVVSTSINDAPTIVGTAAGQAVTDKTTLSPFTSVTLADVDVPAQTQTVSVTLDTAAKGSFTTLNGFTNAGGGVYNFSGTAAATTTAIRGLVFTPTANRVTPGSTETTTFTISTNDGIAATVTNNATTVISTSVNDAPTIAGTAAGQAVTDKATLSPFTSVTLADVDVPAQTQTVSVTLDTAAKGAFTTLNGFTNAGGGAYTLSGNAAAATTAIRGLVFTPAANRVAPGSTETTTFTISINDGVAPAVTNNATTVISTSVNDAPTIVGTAAGQAVTDKATLSPFTSVTLADVDVPAQTQTVSVTLDTAAKGAFTTLNGFTNAGGGAYTFSGNAAAATTAIRGLVFTPAANRVAPGSTETTTFTISINDGVAAAVTNNATTVVSTSVNDAPAGADKTLTTLEDTARALTAADFGFSDPLDNPAGTLIAVKITTLPLAGSLTNNGTEIGAGTFIPVASINAGQLVFTPAVDANGNNQASFTFQVQDDGGTASGGVDLDPTPNSVSVNVTAVNDPPTFTKGSNLMVLEDAGAQSLAGWATAISPGPADENGQTVSFIVTTDNNALFAVQPAIAANGTLSFTPAANTSGSAILSVTAVDSGDTTNGGANASAPQSFTVNVTAVNDAPTLTAISDPAAILEDATTQTINLSGITAGGGENQTLTVTAISDNTALIPNPAVTYASASTTGSLSYKPAADASGMATITVTVQDDGGTADGGVDLVTRTFTVTVTAVNDAPTLAAIVDPAAITEDATLQTINLSGITAGVGETQTLTVSATSDNLALIPNPTISYTSPNSTGTLRYQPIANASGSATITVTVQDDGDTANGGVNSRTQSFNINVLPVNDAPTLAAITDPAAILEDAGTQTIGLAGIGAGGGETQALTVTAASDNPALVPNPTVTYASANSTGSLAYTPVANANGSANIAVTVQDDGGTANGGISQVTRTFTVNVTPVNDVPSFTKGTNVTVREDAGTQTIPGWASAISAGPMNESAQALNFIVTADQPALFSTQPAIAANGTLTFTWAANGSGTATVTVALHDDGGGDDTSAAQTFTISTTSVNDAPSFVAGPSIDTAQDAGAQNFPAWATTITPGPADESAQTLNFIVSVDKPELFTTTPSISPNGALSYTPAPSGSGVAKMTVQLHDDGGVADGGVDVSAPQMVEIAITSFLEELGTYTGLLQPAPSGPRDNERTGTVQMKMAKGGKFTGKLTLGGKRVAMKGTVGHDGVAHFGKTNASTLTVARKGLPTLDLALKIEVARGTNTFEGRLTQSAAAFAVLAGDRSLYTSKRNPTPPLERLPTTLLGAYTVVLPALNPAAQGQSANSFPQGSGFGRLKVSTKGSAKLTATLADGTKLSATAPLAKSGRWPLYRAFGKTGSVSGFAFFRDVPAVSDIDASNLLWCKAAKPRAQLYQNGWPGGLFVDLIGAKYAVPTRRSPGPVLGDLGLADADGNAQLSLTGGGLTSPGLLLALSIDTANRPTLLTSPLEKPAFRLTPKNGMFSGRFIHPSSGRKTAFGGAVLQKQKLGSGFFLGPAESGAVTLAPDDHPGAP